MTLTRTIIALVMAVLLGTGGASAQRLWAISGNGAKGTTYILGTHHVAPLAVLDSTAGFERALADAEVIVGELIMSDMNPEALQGMMMAPADSTLSKLLNPAQIDSLNTLLGRYTGGMLTAGQLDAFKPAMVGTQIAMMENMAAFPGFNPQEQLDTEVQRRALAAGKKVDGFETVEEQMEMLMGDPLTVQARDLMDAVANDAKAIEQARDLAAAYMSGDIDAIGQLIQDPELGFTTESAEKLINRRNRAWLASMKERMPQQSMLVVVGIGHLVGEEGLLASLRNAGYTVTPAK